jgi:hypothetical protein
VLNGLGARYLEFIMRADDLENIDAVLTSKFIPSAYFPAMHREEEGRYDFVVFSRSFEILNFRDLSLEGINQKFMLQYFNLWKELSLPALAEE